MRSSFGAGNQNRTDDLVITNDVLYRLSHTSIICDFVIITDWFSFVNSFFRIFLKTLSKLLTFQKNCVILH